MAPGAVATLGRRRLCAVRTHTPAPSRCGDQWRAGAITTKTQGRPYRVTIFVDGLTRPEQATFTNRLRARGIARKKVRGVRDGVLLATEQKM